MRYYSPLRRAFLNRKSKMTYHFSGILHFEKQVLQRFLHSRKEKSRRELLQDLSVYLARAGEVLQKRRISNQQLSLKSQAAFTTLRGIYDLYQNLPGRYTSIFQLVQKEVENFPKFRDYPLIIRISASSRLSHSIRIQAKMIQYQISISSLVLPDEYFSLLTKILLSRLGKKPVERIWKVKLTDYEDRFTRLTHKSIPKKSENLSSQGEHYHLLHIFNKLNKIYFQETIKVPHIGWSRRKNKYRLGSYHANQKKILISRILDQPDVPPFVVEGIVYHEMLHMIHPIQNHNGRRIIHGWNFKNDEKKFVNHIKLERWLKKDYPLFLGNKPRRSKLKDLF